MSLESITSETTRARQNLQAAREGRVRVAIENITPCIDMGRFPVKRAVGETVAVEADVFGDGHDQLGVALKYRAGDSGVWRETAMRPLVNDR